MVVFEGKNLNHDWTLGEVPGTLYGMVGKDGQTRSYLKYWLKNQFLKYAVGPRPLLLDGHSSHYEPESVEFARSQDVIIREV